jgi:hypothetical protein
MKPGKRAKFPSFVALPRDMLKSEPWHKLGLSAQSVYIQLKRKFVGWNNGELCLHYSELGHLSPATISKCFKQLEAEGWIVREQIIGGKRRFTVQYRLTGKYDSSITSFTK